MGGHIGYAFRLAHRRRGYATALLDHALEVAQSIGMDQVLLTCDVGNEASARVIEKAGGHFERLSAWADESVPLKRRFWVSL